MLSRALIALSCYGNPIRIMSQRLAPAWFNHFEVKDRKSGVTCASRRGAEKLFGEIWFDHDYDVPGVILGPKDIVLDIGANQGFYTCYAASKAHRPFLRAGGQKPQAAASECQSQSPGGPCAGGADGGESHDRHDEIFLHPHVGRRNADDDRIICEILEP